MSRKRDALERRVAALHDTILERAEAGEISEPLPTEVFAMLICNRCGRELLAPDSLVLAARAVLDGWAVGEQLGDDDLCPGCAS